MASLQELRKRLRSIQSTGQLAGAMRTAATAKYAKLGRVRDGFSPYASACRDIQRLLGSAGIRRSEQEVCERDCLVILSGNRGLCGGFNAELMRFLDEELTAHDDPVILACGRKAEAHLRENAVPMEEFPVDDVPVYQEVKAISDRVRTLYGSGEVRRVYVIMQRFRNMLTQTPSILQILPETESVGREAAAGTRPLFLPDPETVSEQLAISCLETRLFDLALESAAGAQAATMMAMRSACDNAENAAAELEIMINRRRQADVTSGVIETASGNYQQGD